MRRAATEARQTAETQPLRAPGPRCARIVFDPVTAEQQAASASTARAAEPSATTTRLRAPASPTSPPSRGRTSARASSAVETASAAPARDASATVEALCAFPRRASSIPTAARATRRRATPARTPRARSTPAATERPATRATRSQSDPPSKGTAPYAGAGPPLSCAVASTTSGAGAPYSGAAVGAQPAANATAAPRPIIAARESRALMTVGGDSAETFVWQKGHSELACTCRAQPGQGTSQLDIVVRKGSPIRRAIDNSHERNERTSLETRGAPSSSGTSVLVSASSRAAPRGRCLFDRPCSGRASSRGCGRSS